MNNTFPMNDQISPTGLSYSLLENFAVIRVTGADRISFLQGQLTCDMTIVHPGDHAFAAQCDRNGKVIIVCQVWVKQDEVLILHPKSLSEIQLFTLKKFAAFSNVDINLADTLKVIALVGSDCSNFISEHRSVFSGSASGWLLPNNKQLKGKHASDITSSQNAPRYLCITPKSQAESLTKLLTETANYFDYPIWTAMNIRAGIGFIDKSTSGEWIPQMLNLQAIGAISFKKGCYIGQEVIARAQFRGTNKRAMFLLSGNAPIPVISGQTIEIMLNGNRKRIGRVISAHNYKNGQVDLLAVLPKVTEMNATLYIKEIPESQLKTGPLPYDLEG